MNDSALSPSEALTGAHVAQELVKKHTRALDRLTIEYVPVDSIKPNDYNPNRQSPHDFEMLCKSIAKNGCPYPVVVNRSTGEIVDGEHRWRAHKHMGELTVPVVWTDMTPEQARVSTLRHNRARGNEEAGLVVELFRELQALGLSDYAQEELLLDDEDMQRLMNLPGDELKGLDLNPDPSQLGADGHGLTEQDKALGIDTTADKRRAQEKMLAEAKAKEEQGMSAVDQTAFRLQLVYTGEEAATVKQVLERLLPEGSAELPLALLALLDWAEQAQRGAASQTAA